MMAVQQTTPAKAEDRQGRAQPEQFPGVVKELGQLGSGAVISEAGLAQMFNRHPSAIKRAVSRGELPPTVRLMGKPVWLAETIIDHLRKRLEAAVEEAEQLAKKVGNLCP